MQLLCQCEGVPGGFTPTSPNWGAWAYYEALAFKKLPKESLTKKKKKKSREAHRLLKIRILGCGDLRFFQSKRGSGNQSLMGENEGGREGVFVTKTELK